MKFKSNSLIAAAVGASFACASAFAGGGHDGGQHDARYMHGNHASTEVQTPASVSESAPWLSGYAHAGGWNAPRSDSSIGYHEGQFSDGPVGTTGTSSGEGSGAFESPTSRPDQSSTDAAYDSSLSDASTFSDSGDAYTRVDYWLIGDEQLGTGAGTTLGGSGSGGYSSMDASSDVASMSDSGAGEYASEAMPSTGEPLAVVYTESAEMIADTLGDATPLLNQHYLVFGPLSSFPADDVIILETGPAAEDVALLDSLSRDFYVLTPSQDEG
jgi:hypothetical protein